MRITQRAISLTSLQGLNRNLTNVSRLQEQLTSGKLVTKPSDSPTSTNRSMQTRATQRATDQYARNMTDGQGWLTQSDTALSTMTDMTHRVRDLALQGKNTGTMSAASTAAISSEVANLREALLGVANQSINGRPIFGGVTGGSTAYDTNGNWVGNNSAPVNRRVSATETIRIDVAGPEAFGAPGNDLFAIVDRIAKNVTSNPGALKIDLDDLDAVMSTMLAAHTALGARHARLERSEQVNADLQLSLASTLSETEDIDLPKTIMELEMQKVGYQAALSATAKAIQPTLMDFLR